MIALSKFLWNGFPECICFQKHSHVMASLTLVKTLVHIFVQWLNTCASISIHLSFTLSILSAIIFLLLLAASLFLDFLASLRAITYLEMAVLHDVTFFGSYFNIMRIFLAILQGIIYQPLILNPLFTWLCPCEIVKMITKTFHKSLYLSHSKYLG